MDTTNRKIVKNNKKLYTFKGTKLVVTDVTDRKEYIELNSKYNSSENELLDFKKRLGSSININNQLKEDYKKIKKAYDQAIELGALEFYKLRLL